MSDNAVKVWCTVKDGCHPKKRDVLVRAFTRNGLGEWEDTTRHPKRKHAAAWDPKDFANQAGITEAAAELPIITQWPKQPVLVTGEEGTTRKVAVLACPRCAPGKQKVTYSDFYADVQGTDNGPHTQPPDMFRQGALDIGWERLTTLLDKFQHAGIADVSLTALHRANMLAG